jgi:hypothetical protein
MTMKIEEIKDIDIVDGSVHYNMISEKGGNVHLALSNKTNEMYAIDWSCPGEGRRFLQELEKYADEHGLILIISNVINPKLEKILRDVGYEESYKELSYLNGDVIQIFKRKNRN